MRPPKKRTPGERRDPLGGVTLVRVLAALGIWTRPGSASRRHARVTCEPLLVAAGPRSGWDGTDGGGRREPSGAASDALLEDVCDRARRAGHAPVTTDHLRAVWATLGPDARVRVAAPLTSDAPTWRGRPAVQVDGTTCGAAVGAMVLAAGDPVVALALETGTVLAGVRHPELGPAVDAAAVGFDALQRHLHGRTSRRAVLGLLPWPRRLGTPPWTLAREARCADVRFRHVVVDATDEARTGALAARIDVHLRAGTPLPLFTGGASRTGWPTAVPRHVVLLVGDANPPGGTITDSGSGPGLPRAAWRVYEPSRGLVLTVDAATWAVPERRDAWGRWSRPHWLVLPR